MPDRIQAKSFKTKISAARLIFIFFIFFSLFFPKIPLLAENDTPIQENKEEKKAEPIIINGDTVEYSTSENNVTATGAVSVDYKGTKISCNKLTVNTQTKEGVAEGNVRLEDSRGVIECQKMTYNFQNKAGVMLDANFRANPYFGRADEMKKINELEFIGLNTVMSTCSFDHPHYRLKMKKVDFIREDKMNAEDISFLVGQNRPVPIIGLPRMQRSFKEPFMKVKVTPGTSKDWGPYLLTAWRYRISDELTGKLFVDFREKRGIAEGFQANYGYRQIGNGDFKFYYMQERDKSSDLGKSVDIPKVFQRYFVRWRHKWNISENTNFTSEYYKIIDSKRAIHGTGYNILKDYFQREYEKDMQPLSYILVHHLFGNSTLDILFQPRTNRWYSQLEKKPEANYTLASSKIGKTPFYYENISQAATYISKNAVPSSSVNDIRMGRIDSYNKFSLPTRVSIFQFQPFVGERLTYYNADINGASIAPRAVFYSGAGVTTKFYRLFNVHTNFLRLDINNLRHVITPTIQYTYNNIPSISNSKLKQIDEADSITTTNSMALELDNKLQTKRNGQSVDFLDFRINNTYTFKSSANKGGGTLSDFLLYLDILPYSWMSLHSDATFARSNHHFSQVNADLNFNFNNDRSIGFGQRYTRKGSKELTFHTEWRVNPKWKFMVYERYQFGQGPDLSRGLREQQYTLIRDLHCWTAEFTWNITKARGEEIWLVFRLKAFPDIQLEYNQNYHQPKPGSQTPGTPEN